MKLNSSKAETIKQFSVPGIRIIKSNQLRIMNAFGSEKECPGTIPDRFDDAEFYEKLLFIFRKPVLKQGSWTQLDCMQLTNKRYGIIAHLWESEWGESILSVVNLSAAQNWCFVILPFKNEYHNGLRFTDMVNSLSILQKSNELFLEMKPWAYHVFDIEKISK